MKKDWWYPTAFSSWDSAEWQAMRRVLHGGTIGDPPELIPWLTMGDECAAFEREFADWHGKKHGIMVNSGSSANLVAVASLFHKKENPLRAGDKVAVPAVAWSTTYAPLVQYGLDLVLLDVDSTWNAPVVKNWRDLHVRLIVGVPILGNPAYMEGVKGARHEVIGWEGVAKRIGAYLIEDACESLGAETFRSLGCRKSGTFGDLSTFSFFQSHQVAAIEGGMVLTDDDELADLCRMLRAHGWTRDIRAPESFGEEYNFVLFGFNVRPLELHAAIAREQLKKLPDFRRHRQQGWRNLELLTRDLPIVRQVENGVMSPFGFAFYVESSAIRAKMVKALREESIDCRLPTGGSFTKHEYGKRWANQATPNADHIHDTGLFLGLAPYNINEKLEKAVRIMAEVLK